MNYQEWEFTIESSLEKGTELVNDLKEKWAKAGMDEETVFLLKLVLEEAVANAIKHGNKYNKDLLVEVRCSLRARSLTLEVVDQGSGFDPDMVADPTSESRIATPGGRGVYLIKNLMDKVEYLNLGRRVRMTKRISVPKATKAGKKKRAANI